MTQMIVLYKTPKDTAAFDREYAASHIPLAKKVPGRDPSIAACW